jgi:hypothetical protein
MIHLGNHPEVVLCPSCGRWAAKQAREIEDRGRTGPLVAVRHRLRQARRGVVERGLHRNRLIGRALRRLGRHLP